MTKRLVLGLLVCIALLGLPVASGVSETRVTCNFLVTQSIKVANSLLNCPEHGLIIEASDITIDLGGNTIDGNGIDNLPGTLEMGVRCLDECQNVVVKNGTFSGFEAGVFTSASSPGVRIIGVTALENFTGYHINGVRNVLKKTSAVDNTGNGYLVNSRRNTLVGNASRGNVDGFVLQADANVLTGNHALLNSQDGFDLNGSDNTLERNRSEDNGADGFELAASGQVLTENRSRGDTFGFRVDGTKQSLTDNVALDSGFDGFTIDGSSNTLRGDLAAAADRFGVVLGGTSNRLIGVTARGAQEAGMFVFGNANVVRSSRGSGSNGDGIFFDGGDAHVLVDSVANNNLDFGVFVDPTVTLAKAKGNSATGNGTDCSAPANCN